MRFTGIALIRLRVSRDQRAGNAKPIAQDLESFRVSLAHHFLSMQKHPRCRMGICILLVGNRTADIVMNLHHRLVTVGSGRQRGLYL